MVILRVLLAVFLLCGIANAATYTVCASGCDYTTIQGVFDGKDLDPDDIVEVRADAVGGTKTYTEQVIPGANDSGTAGHPVILRARAGDTIIISGGNDTATPKKYGISLVSADYFTVDGFTFQDQDANSPNAISGVYVAGTNSTTQRTGITVQNCKFNVNVRTGDSTSNRGITSQYTSGLTLANNTITVSSSTQSAQTDCIYTRNNYNGAIYGNTCYLQNPDSSGHNDCIQILDGSGDSGGLGTLSIYNNICAINSLATSLTQGIYVEYYNDSADTVKIYNNLLTAASSTGSNMINIYQRAATNSVLFQVFNNTVYLNTGGSPGTASGIVTGSATANIITTAQIKNNIVYLNTSPDGGGVCINYGATPVDASTINYNLCYKTGSGNPLQLAGVSKTWANWQAGGCDASGLNEDPVFTTNGSDFTLQSSSNAKTGGADLSAIFTTDLLGSTRSNWSRGAYEYTGASPGVIIKGITGAGVSW